MALRTIGRYQVKSELDRGGMSVVYLAHDPRVDRDVAIKMLPHEVRDQPNVRRRFEREARTVAALEHPAIVPIYDFGEEDRRPYLVMRYMHGGSLADRLNSRMSLAGVARIVTRIASALDEAHAKGVIHRDLKPGNILFDGQSNAFLSDFGIVKIAEAAEASSATGTLVLGTPAYMSPEQALGKPLDRRTDIYALGSVIYEMLTGTPPYSGPTGMSIAMKHVVEAVPSLQTYRPDLPEEADAVLAKAMAKDVNERFESAGAVANALNTVVQAFPQHAAYIPTDAMPARQLPAVPLDTEEVALPSQIPYDLPGQPSMRSRRQVITVVALGFVLGLAAIMAALWLTGQLRLPADTRPTSVPFRPDISFLGQPTFAPAAVPATGVPEFEGTTIVAETEAGPTPTEMATEEPTPTRAADTSSNSLRPFARMVATGGSLVNIRTGPGFDYQLFAVSRGTIITATAYTANSEGIWYQVTVEGGRGGWVSARSVTAETDADELAASELSPAEVGTLPLPDEPSSSGLFPPNSPSTPVTTSTSLPSATPRGFETSTPTPTHTPFVTPTRTPTPSITPSPTSDVMTVTPTPIP